MAGRGEWCGAIRLLPLLLGSRRNSDPLLGELGSLLSNFLPCGANYGPGLGYACRGRFLLLALDRASVRRSEASAMFGPRTLHCPSCQSAAEMRHCSKPQITSIIRAVPPLPEGRFAIVTNVGWDAMAALMSQDEGHWRGRRSRVVLTPLGWC